MLRPEKKTPDAADWPSPAPACHEESRSFLVLGGEAQERYERLRAYALLAPEQRPQISPARFDLERFHRFGLLGLVDGQPTRRAFDRFEVQVIPLGSDDAVDRCIRLRELLAGLLTQPGGGEPDATSCPVRASLDELAGEGADDPKPARGHHALRRSDTVAPSTLICLAALRIEPGLPLSV